MESQARTHEFGLFVPKRNGRGPEPIPASAKPFFVGSLRACVSRMAAIGDWTLIRRHVRSGWRSPDRAELSQLERIMTAMGLKAETASPSDRDELRPPGVSSGSEGRLPGERPGPR